MDPNCPGNRLLVGKADAARLLSVSVRTLEMLVATDQLTVRRIGRRTLVSVDSLRAYANRLQATGLRVMPRAELRE